MAGGLFGKINVTEQPYSPVMKKIARDVSMNPYHGSMETLYLQGKTFEFLAELARIDQDEGKTKDMPRKVTLSKAADAMDILLANPQNPPSPVDLAKAVGVSYSTLKRGFRKYYGQSIYQFANGASLDHAKRILDEMDKTVAEVAYQHGYANPSAFITAFTRRFGYTPGAMKKKGL
ncbi:MAG: AraC family transcriptional regulator [Nitrospinota bacterium]|nr:AraC family transcriptional regulator [Nitrospinota bacterium]